MIATAHMSEKGARWLKPDRQVTIKTGGRQFDGKVQSAFLGTRGSKSGTNTFVVITVIATNGAVFIKGQGARVVYPAEQ